MKQLNIIGSRKEHFIRNLEFSYDKMNDLLYVYKKDSAVYSTVMIGEFHIEFNKGGEVVGIEILNASDLLEEFGISAKLLENIEKVDLKVVTRKHSLLVFIIIHSLKQEKCAAITMNNLESSILNTIVSS